MGFKDTVEKILDKIGENDYKPANNGNIIKELLSLEGKIEPFKISGKLILSLLSSIYFKNLTVYMQKDTVYRITGIGNEFLLSVEKETGKKNPKDALGWASLFGNAQVILPNDDDLSKLNDLSSRSYLGQSHYNDSLRDYAGEIDDELKTIKRTKPNSNFADLLDCFALIEAKLKDEKMLSPNLVESIRKIKNSFASVL